MTWSEFFSVCLTGKNPIVCRMFDSHTGEIRLRTVTLALTAALTSSQCELGRLSVSTVGHKHKHTHTQTPSVKGKANLFA